MEEIQLVNKPCEDCGKVELMAPSCKRCFDCRVARMKKSKADYDKHHAERKKEALARYYRKKQTRTKSDSQLPADNKRIYPVRYIEQGGKFSWHVRFFNEQTQRYCIWESDGEFDSMLEAQMDYCKATR